MAFRVSVTKADHQTVSLEVFQGDTSVKVLQKQYSSLDALNGMVHKWYHKTLPSVPNPNGLFGTGLPQLQQSLQNYFDTFVREVGTDTFAFKSFFRLYDLQGKVIIITGSSSGIGKQNAYQLAEMGGHIILACRSESKTLPIVDDIKAKSGNQNVEYMHLDLVSLASVRKFVEDFKAKNLPLHILINNAGLVMEGITDYGVDLTYGIDHVGPFLLTMSLLDILKATPNSRIVFVASEAAKKATTLPWQRIRSKIPLHFWNALEAYSYAKLSNVLVTKLLAKKLAEGNHQVTTYVLHPGVVATDIWRTLGVVASVIKKLMLNEEEGSMITLHCAIAEASAKESGYFYDYYKGFAPEVPQFAAGENAALAEDCWAETEKMCGLRPA